MNKYKKKLPIGISDFKKVIEGNYYYVDKSHFIQEVAQSSGETLLIPRPRRFGKTLNLSMLRYYFEKLPDGSNYLPLFKGLKISALEGEHREWAGQYPIIFITFKDCKKDTWEETFFHIKAELSSLYREHQYLLQSKNLDEYDLKYFVTDSGTVLKDKLDLLVEGKEIEAIVEDNIVFSDLELRDDLVWSFLLLAGYLKYTRIEQNSIGQHVFFLAIPNQEIRLMFIQQLTSSPP